MGGQCENKKQEKGKEGEGRYGLSNRAQAA
jgi:hypothetical protein